MGASRTFLFCWNFGRWRFGQLEWSLAELPSLWHSAQPQANTHLPSSRRALDLLFLQMTWKETTQDQKMLQSSLTTVSPKPQANNPLLGKIFSDVVKWCSEANFSINILGITNQTHFSAVKSTRWNFEANPLAFNSDPFCWTPPTATGFRKPRSASFRILSRKQFSFLQKISKCIKAFNSHRAHIVVSAQQS